MSMCVIFGSAFACKRYEKYRTFVSWEYHSKYKGFEIERAYELATPELDGPRKWKALYRAKHADGFIVGDGLAQVKDAINEFMGKKEGRR